MRKSLQCDKENGIVLHKDQGKESQGGRERKAGEVSGKGLSDSQETQRSCIPVTVATL